MTLMTRLLDTFTVVVILTTGIYVEMVFGQVLSGLIRFVVGLTVVIFVVIQGRVLVGCATGEEGKVQGGDRLGNNRLT